MALLAAHLLRVILMLNWGLIASINIFNLGLMASINIFNWGLMASINIFNWGLMASINIFNLGPYLERVIIYLKLKFANPYFCNIPRRKYFIFQGFQFRRKPCGLKFLRSSGLLNGYTMYPSQ